MLEGMTPPEYVTPCAIRTLLGKLDESDEKILLDALANQQAWGHSALAKALTDRGLRISEKPIRKHRNKLCSCK
jgi:repressor of nif and glnA expression